MLAWRHQLIFLGAGLPWFLVLSFFRYPPSDYPVLAFTGPPAAFPVQEEHVKLHKYLRWSDSMAKKAEKFITTNVPHRPFLGLHLRNGIVFVSCLLYTSPSPRDFG